MFKVRTKLGQGRLKFMQIGQTWTVQDWTSLNVRGDTILRWRWRPRGTMSAHKWSKPHSNLQTIPTIENCLNQSTKSSEMFRNSTKNNRRGINKIYKKFNWVQIFSERWISQPVTNKCVVWSHPLLVCVIYPLVRFSLSLPHVSVHLMINERTTKSIYHTFVLLIHSIREFILYTIQPTMPPAGRTFRGASYSLRDRITSQSSNLSRHTAPPTA